MRKKYQLTIPEPCNENWNEMPISGKGRDCSKCEKNIRDFSKMSDAELIELMRNETQLCGRFDPSQLNRPLLKDSIRLLPTFNIYAVAAGLGALICFPSYGAEITQCEGEINLIEIVQGNQEVPSEIHAASEDSLLSMVVIGTHLHVPLPNVKIQLIDIRGHLVDHLTTDSNGQVSYSKMQLEELQVVEIVIESSDNYQEARIPWSSNSIERTEVHLKANKKIQYRTMGVVVRPRF